MNGLTYKEMFIDEAIQIDYKRIEVRSAARYLSRELSMSMQANVASKSMSESDEVIFAVCAAFDITYIDIMSDARDKDLTAARGLIYIVLRNKGYTFKRIGDIVNRDYSCVIRQVNAVNDAISIKDKTIMSRIKLIDIEFETGLLLK